MRKHISLNLRCNQRLLSDLVSSDNFRGKGWLINDKSSLELLDAGFASLKTLLDSHILSVVLVQHRVHKVASVAMGALGHLLQCAKVVHPVQLCLLFDRVVATHEHIDLEGGAGTK